MWRSRIFWRLFGTYSVLLTVSFGVLGWLLIGRMENHLLREIQRSLEVKTALIRNLVNQSVGRASRPDQVDDVNLEAQINQIAKDTSARITLIDAAGRVLVDSDEQPSKMENHGERPEVQQAEKSGLGMSLRYSGTLHEPMMYVARRNEHGPMRYVRIALALDAVAAEVGWLRRVVWTVTGITLVGALVLSLLIARRISAPLVELCGAADAIAHGKYGQKVLPSCSDEVGTLAVSFNAMSEACAEHITQMERDREQLRAIFRSMVEGVVVLDAEQTILFVNDAAHQLLGLRGGGASIQGQKVWQVFRQHQLNEAVDKILASDEPYRCELEWQSTVGRPVDAVSVARPTEAVSVGRPAEIVRERRELALQGARLPGEPHRGAVLVFHDITQMRRLETVRQDFVANVSHELKTPLAVIQAAVETLLDGAMEDSQHNTQFLERIRENADRLHRLVQDLLSLGRIESSQAPLDLEAIDLQSAVEACLGRHDARAKAKGLELIVKPFSQPFSHRVMTLADEEALAEILDNLVDNAVKYTPAGGTITLRWFVADEKAIVEVADTGVGIPEKDLPRIFERFYRVDKARSRELGGTGLGLSIVKHLVEALGGSINAASEAGHGSVFSVHLPLVPGPFTQSSPDLHNRSLS